MRALVFCLISQATSLSSNDQNHVLEYFPLPKIQTSNKLHLAMHALSSESKNHKNHFMPVHRLSASPSDPTSKRPQRPLAWQSSPLF